MDIFGLKITFPKSKAKKGASQSTTPTFDGSGNTLSLPSYREHLEDIFDNRVADDTQTLIETLIFNDPDVSAALNAYLTVSDTPMKIKVNDLAGEEDVEGLKSVYALITALTSVSDYSLKFQRKHSMRQIATDLRYMLMMRGSIGAELVFDKFLVPTAIKTVDTASLEWLEPKPNVFKPIQANEAGDPISLDIPNFFYDTYRQKPTDIYSRSPFTAAINTIAARQQVINDLYRIMQRTGYPRIDITVAEEVMMKSIPPSIADDPTQARQWVKARIDEITAQVNNLRADSAFVHTDAYDASLLNEGGPRNSMDVKSVIEVLNSSNQAALKTMATVIGRGDSGVNTSTTEARIFSMSADQLNVPVANILSQMFTFALRMAGSESVVTVSFLNSEMRPELELEPQIAVKQARLLTNLSYGLITDNEYHDKMFNRPKPDAAPELSGTGFLDPADEGADSDISPNADPLGRSVSGGDGAARSNQAGQP